MTKQEKIRVSFDAIVGAFTVLVGVLFIVEAADIYYSGAADGETGMYTRELVGARLLLLLFPVLVWVALIIAGFVISLHFSAPVKGKKRDPLSAYQRLKGRIPVKAEGELAPLLSAHRRYEKIRLIVRCAVGAFCLLAAVMCAVYLCNTANFPNRDLNGEVLGMLANVLPWVGSALAAAVLATAFEVALAGRELPAVKKLVASGGESAPSALGRFGAVGRVMGDRRVLLALRVVLAAAAVTLVVLGSVNGGARDVLVKAINICTECIGLG